MFRILLSLVMLNIALVPEALSFSIPSMYRDAAIENKVPTRVLYAMVYHESKRPVKDGGALNYRPWPWTINHKGRGYYFDTKEDALNHARKLLSEGHTLFDIGLGQINWHYHSGRFNSIEEAFEPKINIGVAAQILSEQYYDMKGCDSWVKAVGCYHRPSRTEKSQQIAKGYAKKIAIVWNEIRTAQMESRLEQVYGEAPRPPLAPKVAKRD